MLTGSVLLPAPVLLQKTFLVTSSHKKGFPEAPQVDNFLWISSHNFHWLSATHS